MDIADHDVYTSVCEVELRPGRRCQVLHIAPPADSVSPKMLFFCHGSMATMQQFGAFQDLHRTWCKLFGPYECPCGVGAARLCGIITGGQEVTRSDS